MTKSPAFQFYPGDFLAGRVATYNLEEIGAYSLLLAFDWSLNGLPTELEKLARLCRVSTRKFRTIWETIGEQFPEIDGRLYNQRLAAERDKQAQYSAAMSENGKKGGKPRVSRGLAAAKPNTKPPESSSSSSSSSTTRTTTTKQQLQDQKLPAPGVADAAPNWVAALVDVWVPRVGSITHGRLGAALKPGVERYGAAPVERAMLAYIAAQTVAVKPCKVQWFAEQIALWVERSENGATRPVIDAIDGEMSPELERMTRPAGYRP